MINRTAKKRSMSINVDIADTTTSWSGSTLVIDQCARNGKSARKVIINIPDPNTLEYLRERLDSIDEYWITQVKRCRNAD